MSRVEGWWLVVEGWGLREEGRGLRVQGSGVKDRIRVKVFGLSAQV